MNQARDQAKADKVWTDCGYDASPTLPDAQEELYLMLKEKRRREGVARRADSAVLAQSLAIWKRYQIYVEDERHKLATINDIEEDPIPELDSAIDAVRHVVNGTPLKKKEIELVVKEVFPHIELKKHSVSACLKFMVKNKEADKMGRRGKFLFTKLHVLMLLVSVLCGCSTSRPHAPQPSTLNYTAIMPRRMPDAPRPVETVRAIPTTVSYALSWTHDPSPGLLTYRVDYWPKIPPVQGGVAYSCMTQTNNCTIQWLEPDREYTFRVVGCDGRRYSELENLHLVVK